MARTGPTTKDTSTIALGLAQIRVGVSASNISNIQPALQSTDSIGALANTKFIGKVDWFKLESGFPLLEDYTLPIRETAALDCAFKEITPANVAMAYGKDPSTLTQVHSGEIALGALIAPIYVRMEAVYTYPNGSNFMTIIFPRAQAVASVDIDLKTTTEAASPIVFESKRADSGVSGGHAVWDAKPLGRILWT